jgi:hypothetical protein
VSRIGLLLAGGLVLPGLTACGSGNPVTPSTAGVISSPSAGATASAGVTPAAISTVVPLVERCHTPELKADLNYQSIIGSGVVASMLMLTNKSSRTCTVYGWAGLGLQDAAGQSIPATTVRKAYPGAATKIALKPGRTAFFGMKWTAGPQCTLAGGMVLTPPNETTQLTVNMQGFGSSERLRVCGRQITIGSLQPSNQGVNFSS